MKRAALSTLLIFLTGSCSWLQTPRPPTPSWTQTGMPPQRVYLLVFDSLSPQIFTDPNLKSFQKIKQKGVVFDDAWIGHIPSEPSISFNVVLSGLLPHSLQFPPWLFLSPVSSFCQSTKDCISWMDQNPDWNFLIQQQSAETTKQSEEQLESLLEFLEGKNLLAETVLLVTGLQGVRASFESKDSSDIKNFKSSHLVKSFEWDSTLRIHLKTRKQSALLELAHLVQQLKGVSEVYYRTITSGRSHYIRTFRSPSLDTREMDWVKSRRPILTQSLAGPNAPDILAFFSVTEERALQTIPLALWAPNLRFDHPSTIQQLSRTRARLVDIAPLILETLKYPVDSHLEGSSLGLQGMID